MHIIHYFQTSLICSSQFCNELFPLQGNSVLYAHKLAYFQVKTNLLFYQGLIFLLAHLQFCRESVNHYKASITGLNSQADFPTLCSTRRTTYITCETGICRYLILFQNSASPDHRATPNVPVLLYAVR